MQKISSLIRFDREFTASVQEIENAYKREASLPIAVNGLTGGAMDAYISEVVREARRISCRPVLVLTDTEEQRDRIFSVLNRTGLNALRYKSRDLVFNNISASHDVDRERLSVLFDAANGECDAVVSTAGAALECTMPKGILLGNSLRLKLSSEIELKTLASRLSNLGFSRVDNVESEGQFAIRGGIVDFWGAGEGSPVRVEFFGDEIDRIAAFDPITQRTLSPLDTVLLLPAKEVLIDEGKRRKIASVIEGLLKNEKISEDIRDRLGKELAIVNSTISIDFRDKYLGIIYEEKYTLLNYMCDGGRSVTILEGTSKCLESAKKKIEILQEEADGMLSAGAISNEAAKYTASTNEFNSYLTDNLTVHINPFASGIGNMKLSGLFGFRSRRSVSYGNNPSMLIEDLTAYVKGMYRTLILSENSQGVDSLVDTLSEAGISAAAVYDIETLDFSSFSNGAVIATVGSFDGFDLPDAKIAVLSMSCDTGRAVMKNKRRQRLMRRLGGSSERIMSYQDLKNGDYVVHANYGIGLFEGIEAVTVGGVTKDYITIRYAGTDKLFVPCDRLEMIGKYIGQKDKNGKVKLSYMGGGDWSRAKTRAKASVVDVARDLIRLYAERQSRPGFAFDEDSELENEFASDFQYEETDSQLAAIEDIKKDMTKPTPMNRLLCGDVGFGKTEVALRAAFKAVLCGKQVAILVPTTILALQHYQTATSRMRGYAVNVDMLSRLRRPKERAEIENRVRRGEIDILIGTHTILSKGLKFKDLGLLIIDEEQRFGVIQKERLREMAKNVDTLMLSATPIPRTLNMAMSGINDISVLDEAPGERRPVQTYVMEHDDGIIFDAIRKEINRRGQVFYIYNKIENLAIVADRIMNELPMARVAVAHGQMEKEELEDIWQNLVRGEIDVLVCTTIIETGVDLPNANTLIIENADCFGLSQLHQIRGRVGRSERQAYAYFTYRKGRVISEEAEKRLDAIREFAEFGAGFKVALRDLEIRGAGNILGKEQHGHIESVGYDLYLKLLADAISELKGNTQEDKFESTIVINISANIPEKYIEGSAERMEMYKKISTIENEEDALDTTDEFLDRFGEIPKETKRLINVALAKALASKARIKKVEATDTRLTFVSDRPDIAVWAELFATNQALSFAAPSSPIIIYRMRRDEDPTEAAARLLKEYDRARRDLTEDSEKEKTEK